MPIHELLAQAVCEHEALQSKHDEALAEISFLRTRLADSQSWDFSIKSTGDDMKSGDFAIDSVEDDIEVVPLQQHFVVEPFHSAPPKEVRMKSTESFHRSISLNPSLRHSEHQPSTGSSMARHTFYDEGKDSLPVGDTLPEKLIRFLRHPATEFILVLIVTSNVIVLVMETDMRAAKKPIPMGFTILDWVYLVTYISEFCLRVVAYRKHVFDDKWTRLDFGVIVVDVLSVLLKAIFGSGAFAGLNSSMFRLLRGGRLIRAFKILRFVKELQLLIHGFLGAVKAVFWATGMLEIMVLLWSLIYVEVLYPRVEEMSRAGKLVECPRCDKAYSSVWHAHMTIWQQIIAGDGWGMLTMDVIHDNPLVTPIYITALMTIQFAMLNLIFTVIVDAAIRTREDDEQQKLREKENNFVSMRDKLVSLCTKMDPDESGDLTLDELLKGYEDNQEFADTMLSLDITGDDIATLFMIMDEDRSGAVSYMEFVNNIYKMREQDIHTMLMFVKGYVIDLRFKMKEDVTTLLKENLRKTLESAKHIEAMMEHVESLITHVESVMQHLEALVSNSNSNSERAIEEPPKAQEPVVQPQPTIVYHEVPSSSSHGPASNRLPPKELAFILESQADILRLLTKKKMLQTPKTPKALDASSFRAPLSPVPNKYLVLPKSEGLNGTSARAPQSPVPYLDSLVVPKSTQGNRSS